MNHPPNTPRQHPQHGFRCRQKQPLITVLPNPAMRKQRSKLWGCGAATLFWPKTATGRRRNRQTQKNESKESPACLLGIKQTKWYNVPWGCLRLQLGPGIADAFRERYPQCSPLKAPVPEWQTWIIVGAKRSTNALHIEINSNLI